MEKREKNPEYERSETHRTNRQNAAISCGHGSHTRSGCGLGAPGDPASRCGVSFFWFPLAVGTPALLLACRWCGWFCMLGLDFENATQKNQSCECDEQRPGIP